MHLAAVHLDIRWEHRPANHQRIRHLLDQAELPPDTLIILPEMFDVGLSMNKDKTDPGDPSASEAFCRQLAIDRNAAVLAGVVARAASGKLANEAIAFSPSGD